MNLKFANRLSLPYSVALFVAASVLLSFSVFGKSKAWNQAFNACTQKMQDAYADCLNKPYNSVEMCQNVANGVYNRCMRGKGFYPREGEAPPVKSGDGTKPTTSGGKSSPSPTPRHIRPIDTSVSTVTTIKASPTPTPTPKRSHGERK